jgi:hypothetical protein
LTDLPAAVRADHLRSLTALDDVRHQGAARRAPAGVELAALLEAAPVLKEEVVASGRPSGIATGDLATWSYPTAFALGGAASSPVAWVRLTSRLLVVQWKEAGGAIRTLLWEPADHDRAAHTPYYARRRTAPGRGGAGRVHVHGTVLGHLRALGIDPADVDYLAFSQLQTHDVRRLIGTTAPAPDLVTRDAPLQGWFEHATLLVRRQEWEALANLHPLQAPWYQPQTFVSLDPDRVGLLDDDVLLGPGVALVATPGRTGGHVSLVLATDDGVWVSSSNGVAADAWAPRASRIPGLRAWSLAWGQEVVGHTNGSEFAAWQYDSMMLERHLADVSPTAPFPQILPTAELTPHRRAVGLSSGHHHGGLTHGRIRGSSPVPTA